MKLSSIYEVCDSDFYLYIDFINCKSSSVSIYSSIKKKISLNHFILLLKIFICSHTNMYASTLSYIYTYTFLLFCPRISVYIYRFMQSTRFDTCLNRFGNYNHNTSPRDWNKTFPLSITLPPLSYI